MFIYPCCLCLPSSRAIQHFAPVHFLRPLLVEHLHNGSNPTWSLSLTFKSFTIVPSRSCFIISPSRMSSLSVPPACDFPGLFVWCVGGAIKQMYTCPYCWSVVMLLPIRSSGEERPARTLLLTASYLISLICRSSEGLG